MSKSFSQLVQWRLCLCTISSQLNMGMCLVHTPAHMHCAGKAMHVHA